MIQPDTLLSSERIIEEDYGIEVAIRPKRFSDYVGQDQVADSLKVFIEAACRRGEALDHVLIFGPPGLGKTTLGHVIAHEMGVKLHQTSGPILDKTGDLAALLTNLEPRDVLFIDEIHRLNPTLEEFLYPAMEDRRLNIMIGEGPAARSIHLDLPPFTLVGATTRAGLLTAPLRDRFGIINRLEFYQDKDLANILYRSAKILGVELTDKGAVEIASRSRGTPRIANRLLRRVRDFALVKGTGQVDRSMAHQALDLLQVDQCGFDETDRRFLQAIIQTFEGGPVGIESLSAALGDDRGTLEDMIEPFLLQQGFIMRTPRGRIATRKAYAHFGLGVPGSIEVYLGENDE